MTLPHAPLSPYHLVQYWEPARAQWVTDDVLVGPDRAEAAHARAKELGDLGSIARVVECRPVTLRNGTRGST